MCARVCELPERKRKKLPPGGGEEVIGLIIRRGVAKNVPSSGDDGQRGLFSEKILFFPIKLLFLLTNFLGQKFQSRFFLYFSFSGPSELHSDTRLKTQSLWYILNPRSIGGCAATDIHRVTHGRKLKRIKKKREKREVDFSSLTLLCPSRVWTLLWTRRVDFCVIVVMDVYWGAALAPKKPSRVRD